MQQYCNIHVFNKICSGVILIRSSIYKYDKYEKKKNEIDVLM